SPKGLAEALAKAKIRVLLQEPANTFAQVYAQMVALGRITGHAAAAKALVSRMKTRITKLVKAAPKRSASVYDQLTPAFDSARSSSIIGVVLKLFSLRNIADAANTSGAGAVQLSAEFIVSSSPDLIVLADTRCCGVSRATAAARPGWSTITAVKRGAIAVID